MTSAATEIKLIHIGRSALGLDDATYRQMLARLCGGKTSSKLLDQAERQSVLQHLKASGFKVRPNTTNLDNAWRRGAQMRKLRAMWYALAAAGEVTDPADSAAADAAIEAWAKRQLSKQTPPLDALRFASGEQMAKLIESMKRWAADANDGAKADGQ